MPWEQGQWRAPTAEEWEAEKRARAGIGQITGRQLPYRPGRGRPLQYINADARKLHARIREVEHLIAKLAREVGFTIDKHKQMTSRLTTMRNLMNLNSDPEWIAMDKARKRKAAKKAAATRAARRKNPSEVVHRMLVFSRDGEMLTVCGHRPNPSKLPCGTICSTAMVTEWPELVDCPDCLAAE
jgi:hypothetical protein